MEDPGLGVESELQLLADATATATWDQSRVCNLHHLSKAREQTHISIDTSRVCVPRATMGGPPT